MGDRTALSLQTEERLQLAEVMRACQAAGMGTSLLPGILYFDSNPDLDSGTWVGSWNGEREDPMFTCACRDAVLAILPGSYVIPVPHHSIHWKEWPVRVCLRNAYGVKPNRIDNDPERDWRLMPDFLFGRNETECWACALVAIYRAGLLPGGGA